MAAERTMGRRGASFSQADLQRAIRATQAAGLPVRRCEVMPDGRISVVVGDPEPVQAPERRRVVL